jgi:hypothetical protein
MAKRGWDSNVSVKKMPQCGIFSEAGGKAICKHKKAANGTKRRKTDDITLSAIKKHTPVN